ncbi:MAG: T9SS type A sorting domain-containing protein [Saprospiraceae bacterium]
MQYDCEGQGSTIDFNKYNLGDMDNSCCGSSGITVGGVTGINTEVLGDVLTISLTEDEDLFGVSVKVNYSGSDVREVDSDILTGFEYNVMDGYLHIIWVDTTSENLGIQYHSGTPLFNVVFNQAVTIPLSITDNDNLILDRNRGILELREVEIRGGSENRSAISIWDNNNENKISIYPVPVGDWLNIEDNNGAKINKVRIFGIKGELIREFTNLNREHIMLDIKDILGGAYILEAIYENGEKKNLKFIKN